MVFDAVRQNGAFITFTDINNETLQDRVGWSRRTEATTDILSLGSPPPLPTLPLPHAPPTPSTHLPALHPLPMVGEPRGGFGS